MCKIGELYGNRQFTCNQGSERLRDRQSPSNRCIYKVEEISVLVDCEAVVISAANITSIQSEAYRLAAFAVSMTLPPPIL